MRGFAVSGGPSGRTPGRRNRRSPIRPVQPERRSPTFERFRSNDRYRADREWRRYQGTAQRVLFRELRQRFLLRHAPAVARALDAGSGPGRFTGLLGGTPAPRRVALDIGREMLVQLRDRWPRGPAAALVPDIVRGDARRPPFLEGSFGVVAAMGNVLGFAEESYDDVLHSLVAQLSPSGTLLVEVAPGPGERSRYLHRLPARSVARLFRAPPRAVVARVEREGFVEEAPRRSDGGEFRRVDPATLRAQLETGGFRVEEVLAVAPALGPDAARIDAVSHDAKAWEHLLETEESLGRIPSRWTRAAAVLLAAVGPGDPDSRSPLRWSKSEG